MNIKTIIAITAIVIFSSCENSPKIADLYLNTADSQKAYNNSIPGNLIKFEKAHSGNYAFKINKENPYSGTFDLYVEELNNTKPSKVTLTAWIYAETLNSEPQLVIETRDTAFNMKEWLSEKAITHIKQEKEWTKVDFSLDLNQNQRNDLKNRIRAYVSNGEEGSVYVDDISLVFE